MTTLSVASGSVLALCGILLVELPATAQKPASTDTIEWFQTTEQSLMDAVAAGDTKPWERVLAENCIVTSEEGEVTSKAELLKQMRPLPTGLKGGIAVKELTVQEFPAFAVVRYLADEWETVFGQRLTTKYRVTDTFHRAGSEWRMVASHVSVVTGDPPPQKFSSELWPGLVGDYKLLPDGWTFHVVLQDGKLYGARNTAKLKLLIPLTPDAFVLEGSLGDWLFVVDKDKKATHIVNFRKFEPLIWTKVAAK